MEHEHTRLSGDRRVAGYKVAGSGSGFELQHAKDDGTFSAADLVRLLKIASPAELEGDVYLLELAIPDDFVFQEGASEEVLLRDLQEIITDEVRAPVQVEFRNAERTVYRATGEIKLNLRNEYSGIQMNAGHFCRFSDRINTGNLDRFLQNLSAYINIRVVNAYGSPTEQLKWSERSYKSDPTQPIDNFRINPAVVLREITEQTGIIFTEERQVVRTLFIE